MDEELLMLYGEHMQLNILWMKAVSHILEEHQMVNGL